MIKTALTCAMVFNLSNGGSKEVTFTQISQSKNISQLLRSNSDHFWSVVKDSKSIYALADYIQEKGIVNGDPHLGNFSVVPVLSKKGKPELKFLNIDFDDGGVGPFALAFARYAAVARATSKDLYFPAMFEAYFKGLRGEKMSEPKSVNKAEKMTLEKYEAKRAKYVSKRVSDNAFKMIEGEIEKWEGRPNKKDIAAILPEYQVLDVAKRPLERGGSLNSLRLWVLVSDKAGTQRIIELKEYQETALAHYMPQPEMKERVSALFEVFWRKTDPSSYSLATVSGKTYWVREKKVEILEYKDKAEEDEGRIYIANLMGRFQASQPEGAKFLAKIEKDPTRFKEAVKVFVKEYLLEAKEVMK